MPAVNPDDALRVAKAIADLYGEATARLLGQVTERLAKGLDDPGLSSESWALAKLTELAGLRTDAQRVVNELQGSVMAELPKQLRAANEQGAMAAAREMATGRLDPSFRPRVNEAAVRALVRESLGNLQGANGGILRSTLDIYRSVIAETSAPGVVVGAESRVAATQRALDRFAQSGITGFVDAKGRQYEIQSYAEMATRTAAQRSMVRGRIGEYRARDLDLVIVSDSPGECELCEPWEGQVLSLSGDGVGDTYDGFEVIATLDDAESEGLLHPNCRHDVRPFIPGLTQPMEDTSDPAGDQIRQEQRRLERSTREWKRREAVALTPDAKSKAQEKVGGLGQRLNLIAENPAEYAAQAAKRAEGRGNAAGAEKWTAVAADAPTQGKRLARREQINRAR